MINSISSYKIKSNDFKNKEEEILDCIKKRSDLRIFKYENEIVNDVELLERCREELSNRAPSFGRYFYELILKFFSKDYTDITTLMDSFLSSKIPLNAARNDSYFRILYFIATETGDREHYLRAYYGLSFNVGLMVTSSFLQTRRHAYILDCLTKIDQDLPAFKGELVEPDKIESSKENINIVGIMRVRNEVNIIESAISTLSNFVDAIVVYDDCSDDGTLDVIKRISTKYKVKKIIDNKAWLFNESYAHNKLFEAARSLDATHFVQLDADEILSGHWLKTGANFRDVLSIMKPGDCLALPWLDMTSDSSILDRSKLTTKEPLFRGRMFKDIAYCDDGLSYFDPLNSMHVNIVPSVYKKRYIITDNRYALLHLENLNLENLIVKKDWYKVFEFVNERKNSIDIASYNISAEINSWKQAESPYHASFESYTNFKINRYEQLSIWRIKYIADAISSGEIGFDHASKLQYRYEDIFTDYQSEFHTGVSDLKILTNTVASNNFKKYSDSRVKKLHNMNLLKYLVTKIITIAPLYLVKRSNSSLRNKSIKAITFFSEKWLETTKYKFNNNKLESRSLAVCLGKPQFETLQAVIKKRYNSTKSIDLLIYYKDASIEKLEQLAEDAHETGLFSNIYISEDLFQPNVIRGLRKLYKRNSWKAKLVNDLGYYNYEELVLPKLFHPPEKAIVETFLNSSIVLYDEGLRSKIDMKINRPTLKQYEKMTSSGIASEHLKRIVAYYTNNKLLGVPNYIIENSSIFIQKNKFPHFHSDIVCYLDNESDDCKQLKQGNYALLITQNLYNTEMTTMDNEIDIYKNTINYLKGIGLDVKIKFHPRDSSLFKKQLLSSIHGVEDVDKESKYTAEKFLENNRPRLVVGVISSALVTIAEKYPNLAYTIVGTNLMKEGVTWDKDHLGITGLVENTVPPISFYKLENTGDTSS
ncbi:polysialyltransferase family glycosyltransferase [Polycladidibacter stylochi]|uniref:polysialyltransferase family glycosyltransferase n=1 Tax=Polycladidibacter stylochi TaxID=1807766 RepID=UPI00082E05E4|nr:polysialyltransferase family glycosyltransferase [Pseudovibrio stylochi]